MARVTDADVEAIIQYDDSIDLTPFITVANQLVTELCSDSGYSDARLLEIERWLSAHFYHIDDQHVAMEKAGEVTASYQYKIDLAINQTKYGQMAMVLDTAGNLAQLNKRIVDGESASISIGWLGEDYDDEDETD
jgi:hypothetical protein